MTTLQFSLFFAGLLAAYALVHVRLVRFERYLQEVVGVKSLNERLERIAQSLERVRLERAEQGLAQLHEDLIGVGEALARVERATRRSQELTPTVVASAAPVMLESQPSARIRDLVTDRLLSLGYGNLRLLTDLRDASLEDRAEVVVECERNHLGYKGKVVTRNGAVLDVQLQAVTQAFP